MPGVAVDLARSAEYIDALADARQTKAVAGGYDEESDSIVHHRHQQEAGGLRDLDRHVMGFGMRGDVGQALLYHAVNGDPHFVVEVRQVEPGSQDARHLRISLPKGAGQLAERGSKSQPLENRWPQPLQHAAYHCFDPAGDCDDGLGAGTNLGATPIADRDRIRMDGGDALPDLVVQVAREARALILLHLHQAPRQTLILRDALLEGLRHVIEADT